MDRNQERRTGHLRLVGAGLAMAMLGFLTLGILMLAALAMAQEVPIETYPEPRKPESRLEPGRAPDWPTRAPEAGAYSRDVGVRHEPSFIEPLAGRYRTKTGGGRFGLSGWTAPNVPAGPGASGPTEVHGWLSLGFTFTWGDPY